MSTVNDGDDYQPTSSDDDGDQTPVPINAPRNYPRIPAKTIKRMCTYASFV